MNSVCRQFWIEGMTCVNCKNKIERKLRELDGILEAEVRYEQGTARITYDEEVVSFEDILSVIEELDYDVRLKKKEDPGDIGRVVCLLVIIVCLYVLLQRSGVLNLLVPSRLADTGMGYGMLFLVGLITSVHCIAMCGGINLTQCIPSPEGRKGSTFRPALLYNLGRVISYTVIGFILGFAGMLIGGGTQTGGPTLLQGILKLIAGIFMVIMGVNMLGIFPWLRRFSLRMPRALAVRIGRQKANSRQPLIVGLLNGLMPCGPLQSMQIVALATANPVSGALSMFLFSLGTVPLMLGLGSLVSALGRRFARKVTEIGAVLVVVLGLAMISQGGSLSGMLTGERLLALVIVLSIFGVIGSLPFKKSYRLAGMMVCAAVLILCGTVWNHIAEGKSEKEIVLNAEDVELVDGVQVVNSTLEPGSYPDITVLAGTPVRWVINAPENSINGCNYKMLLEEYGIEYAFQTGENVIEFTPGEAGTVSYTCWMGMIHGNIYVVDAGSSVISSGEEQADNAQGISTGGCCGSSFDSSSGISSGSSFDSSSGIRSDSSFGSSSGISSDSSLGSSSGSSSCCGLGGGSCCGP